MWTDCELVARTEALVSNQDIQVARVKDLGNSGHSSSLIQKGGSKSEHGWRHHRWDRREAELHKWELYERGVTRVINVEKIAIEAQMLPRSHLNSGIGRLQRDRAWGEGQFGKEGKGWQGDFGETL